MSSRWQEIFRIERSDIDEVSIFGSICVVAGVPGGGQPRKLAALGDISRDLWTRSLLKPWQLMSHLRSLQEQYPALTPEHIAMMMSSQSAEPNQQELLEQIMRIGGVTEDALQCPPAYPLVPELRRELMESKSPQRRLYHQCAGKHLGYILSMKAFGQDYGDYLNPNGPQFVPLLESLSSLLHRNGKELKYTTDGCQMPNYAGSIENMTDMYWGLANPDQSEEVRSANLVKDSRQAKELMTRYPFLIGGTGRLDTKIMSGAFSLKDSPDVIAKEGADGLLAIGVGACAAYPHGLAAIIKLASGPDAKLMERVAHELFAQLGLREHDKPYPSQPAGARTDHLRIKFNFELNGKAQS